MGLFLDSDTEKYQTLVVSLPHLPLSLHEETRPLSPVIMEDRMEMLEADDRLFYAHVASLFEFSKNSMSIDEDEILRLQRELEEHAPTEAIKELFFFLHEVAIIVSALRMRKNDIDFTGHDGIMASHIRRNWFHPTFKLGEQFPWIDDIRLLLEKNDIQAAHRRVSEIIWSKLLSLSEKHFFNYKAVLLYVLRWNIVRIWATRDLQKGRDRFHNEVQEVIDSYGELFS